MGNAEPAGVSQETAEVARRYMDALGNQDTAALAELLHDDLAHDFDRGADVDMSGDKAVEYFNQAGPVDFEVHDLFGHDDRVAGRFSFTVSGDAVEGAQGGSAKVHGIVIARVQDGKIVEVAHEVDKLGLLKDLGWSIQPPS